MHVTSDIFISGGEVSKRCMDLVCEYMNSAAFPAKDGRGLEGLCKSWCARCQDVLDRDGGRIPR